jgi:hypothetical protein
VAAEQEGRGQESGLLCDESDGVLLVDKEHALCGSGIQGYLSNACALLRPKVCTCLLASRLSRVWLVQGPMERPGCAQSARPREASAGAAA